MARAAQAAVSSVLLCSTLLCSTLFAPTAGAQSSSEAERKLQTIKRELKTVSTDRRRIEGQRGDATRKLRAADEQVGSSTVALRATQADLVKQRNSLATLKTQRAEMATSMAAERVELAQLLRAAYRIGDDAPLQVALSQDRVADAQRQLTYHRYLQAERSTRIAELTGKLEKLDALEKQIGTRQAALDAAQVKQREQLAKLERDRVARAQLVSQLDKRYADRAAREKVLGRDAKALEQVLAQLRIAARQAAAARRAEAAAAKREAAAAARNAGPAGSAEPGTGTPVPPRKRVIVATAPPVQVGGLGWPLSGSLLAGFGGRMPDGRSSTGLLIAAPAGTTVKCVADGSVVFSEWMTGYGNILIVDHGNGYMSLYAHNDALLHKAGDTVKRGDGVASVGNSGGQGRPALYFELRRDGRPVDPNSWLQKR